MAKLRITFDVDTVELFDMLQMVNGNCGPIGQRLAAVMMTGEASAGDHFAMAFYGISFEGVTKLE